MKPADIVALVRASDSFVVRDYSLDSENPDEQPVVAVVPASALFEIIEDAHKTQKRITISPVGPPIIDWRK
jgi:hypothetical protein